MVFSSERVARMLQDGSIDWIIAEFGVRGGKKMGWNERSKLIDKVFVVTVEITTSDYYEDLYTCEQMKDKMKDLLAESQFATRVVSVKTKRKIKRKVKPQVVVERRIKD